MQSWNQIRIMFLAITFFIASGCVSEMEELVAEENDFTESVITEQADLERAVDHFLLGDPSLVREIIESGDADALQDEMERRSYVVRDEYNSDTDLYFEVLAENYPDVAVGNSFSENPTGRMISRHGATCGGYGFFNISSGLIS